MGDIAIRQARESDADAIVELWMGMMREHQAMDSHIRLAENAAEHYRSYLRMNLSAAAALVLVASEGDRPVGFTLAMLCPNLPMFEPGEYGYLSDMVVLPSHRDRGIGEQMLERARAWFRKRGVSCLQLQVYGNNDAGRRFWARAGFEGFLSRLWLDL